MKKILIVKIGKKIATTSNRRLNAFRIKHLVKQIQKLHKQKFAVLLVVSAAVSCGEKMYGQESSNKQFLAGIGQAYVTTEISRILEENNLQPLQMLLTKADLKDSKKRTQIREVLMEAIKHDDVVTILNENDVVELNSFSGNDFLASEVAQLIGADHLLMLTDVAGVYDEHMNLIACFTNQAFKKLQNKTESVGGMHAKIMAGKKAAGKGVKTVIAYGKEIDVLVRLLLHEEQIGTEIV